MIKPSLIFYWVLLTLSSCTLHVTLAQSTDPVEVNALRAVRRSLMDLTGNLKLWDDGDPCVSNWTGVFCDPPKDGYLHIGAMQLLNLNLSGILAPELGLLTHVKILDFMWNNLTGTIPKEIGNMVSLELLLLSGNNLAGPLPEELGNLTKLDRLQIDQNKLSGSIPQTFVKLINIKHIHMNNNSLSGQIPSGLSRLPKLYHLLVDNNNLSGYLPEELASMPLLKILQLDNNNFSGSLIPASYKKLITLVKLSLRNCSLQGTIPDLSGISQLGYLDLSWNQLKGPLPFNLSKNITTINLSNNFLNGTIPLTYAELPKLQRLSLENNLLNGSVSSSIWTNMNFGVNDTLILDFQKNKLDVIPNTHHPPANVTLLLYGNPVCAKNQSNTLRFCQKKLVGQVSGGSANSENSCTPCSERDHEYNPSSAKPCLCSIPLGVGFRLKSPGISDFRPYIKHFETHLTLLLQLHPQQLYIDSYIWESGPRLKMQLKLFPNNSALFDLNEVYRLGGTLASWDITLSDVYGPYELLNFSGRLMSDASRPTLSKGVLAGTLVGAIAGAALLSTIITFLIMRKHGGYRSISKKRSSVRTKIKINGVKCFTFEEMLLSTRNFSKSTLVGHGGYGKVYKGTLDDGTLVAIKRAQEGSLQGSKEFSTEIDFLSRLHHRNLVSLIGYCNEGDEQVLVYEFMPNGTLRDHLCGKNKEPLCFSKRLYIALGSARGILYLHSEADPPIFHRDIKASNILLDFKFVAKVADFGLSRLAPVPDTDGTVPGYVSTVVKGTPGYLDPEYILTHKLTDKSDVYSLGVVFLELLTGLRPISHGKNIVREVRNACQSGLMFTLVDDRMGSYPAECMEKFVSLAVRCCNDETEARPSMAEVVSELEEISRMMPEDGIAETPVTDSSKLVSSSFVSSENSSGDHDVNSGTSDLIAR